MDYCGKKILVNLLSKLFIIRFLVILHYAFCDDTTEQEAIVFDTSQANFSWWIRTHQKVIISSADLAKIPADQLPLEYWVPIKPKLHFWPNKTIAFEIHQSFDQDQRKTIRVALADLSKTLGSCIEFREKRFQDDDYLHFRKAKSCRSPIGYKGGKHLVKLSDGCLDPEALGAIQHEVLHALGFFHEHSRNDRDEFIEINWDNVLPVGKRDLKKLKFRTFGLPYDYTSVMHYTYDAYAINDEVPTLLPKSSTINMTMLGQRKGLSSIDIQRVSIPYKCQSSLQENNGEDDSPNIEDDE